jgi:hypothetical protein
LAVEEHPSRMFPTRKLPLRYLLLVALQLAAGAHSVNRFPISKLLQTAVTYWRQGFFLNFTPTTTFFFKIPIPYKNKTHIFKNVTIECVSNSQMWPREIFV